MRLIALHYIEIEKSGCNKQIYYSNCPRHCRGRTSGQPVILPPLHCIDLHCIDLHCIALNCKALHCIVVHCIVLHCFELCCIALEIIVLCCFVCRSVPLHCILCLQLHCVTCMEVKGELDQKSEMMSFRLSCFTVVWDAVGWQLLLGGIPRKYKGS